MSYKSYNSQIYGALCQNAVSMIMTCCDCCPNSQWTGVVIIFTIIVIIVSI